MRTTTTTSRPSVQDLAAVWPTEEPLVFARCIGVDLQRRVLGLLTSSQPLARSYQGMVDPTLRQCEYVPVPDDLAAEITRVAMQLIFEATGVITETIESQPGLLYRYGPGVGFVAHHDEVTEIEVERSKHNGQPVIGGDLSVVTFLSSPQDYVGGELFFEDPAVDIKPDAGSVVVFPATRAFMHGVRAVISGERCSMLTRLRIVDAPA